MNTKALGLRVGRLEYGDRRQEGWWVNMNEQTALIPGQVELHNASATSTSGSSESHKLTSLRASRLMGRDGFHANARNVR